MTKKKTKEEAVEDFIKVHGDKYSYDKFEYITAKTKSVVCCPYHGDFEITSDSHRSGVGCRKCSFENSALIRAKSFEQWVEEAHSSNNNKYTYNKIYQQDGHTYFSASCPDHGIFEIRASHHIKGHSCSECGLEKRAKSRIKDNLEGWIEECSKIHDSFYSYENCKEYGGIYKVMNVTCPLHGVFEIKAYNHKIGRGCTSCAQYGYDRKAPSHLYILQDEDLTKIGITNKLPSQGRLQDINRKSEKNFFVYHTFYHEDGGKVLEIEQAALKYFKALYPQPVNYFHGARECFINLDPEIARQHIEKLFQSLTDKAQAESL